MSFRTACAQDDGDPPTVRRRARPADQEPELPQPGDGQARSQGGRLPRGHHARRSWPRLRGAGLQRLRCARRRRAAHARARHPERHHAPDGLRIGGARPGCASRRRAWSSTMPTPRESSSCRARQALLPIIELDGRRLGEGVPGPVWSVCQPTTNACSPPTATARRCSTDAAVSSPSPGRHGRFPARARARPRCAWLPPAIA